MSVLLALLAGVLGYLMARGTGPLLRSIMPPLDLPFDLSIRSSPGALLFVFAITLVTGILFGLTPALEVTRQDLVSTLTTGKYFGPGEEPRPYIYIPLRQEMQTTFIYYSDLDHINEAARRASRIDPVRAFTIKWWPVWAE